MQDVGLFKTVETVDKQFIGAIDKNIDINVD